MDKHTAKLDQKYSFPKKKSLGSGGNAVVCKVLSRNDHQEYALKRLDNSLKNNKEKRLRFEDEIKTLVDCQGCDGVIPIMDYSLEELWYTMPLAEKIDKHITTIDAKVDCVLQIADAISLLHERGYSHRDIKPANILFYKNRFVLCDFGLVDIPDNPNDLTRNDNRIGSMNTIAPEMKRNAKDADGKKADVYSLAKTLWILLTGITKGFDGTYDYEDPSMALSCCQGLRPEHLVEIEELLRVCTQNEPAQRPTMREFTLRLRNWKEIKKDEFKKSQSNWRFLLKRIFGNHVTPPSECKWNKVEDVVSILEKVNQLPVPRYMFLPDGGDLDFTQVELASDYESLDIHSGGLVYRLKPKNLIFARFSVSAWNYFLLELEEQTPVIGDHVDEYTEEVVEDKPGHYVSATDFVYGVYDYDTGLPLPAGARLMTRFLRGKILIVLKLGPYNFINESTDGRHANCTSDEFKNYIASLENAYRMKSDLPDDTWRELRRTLIDGCPFKPKKEWLSAASEQMDIQYEKDYVKNHYAEFDFSDIVCIASARKEGAVTEYQFELENCEFNFLSEMFSKEHYFLCSNGKIEKCNDEAERILSIYDMSEASGIYTACCIRIQDLTDGKVAGGEVPYFDIHIRRIGNPSRMFSKKEIKKLMEEADDRVNNTLVIDGDGYARMVQEGDSTALYPVVHETWCSRKNYVGKYSRLSDLDSAYHYCLAKWCDYLENNVGQPMEDYDSCPLTEAELMRKIEGMLH